MNNSQKVGLKSHLLYFQNLQFRFIKTINHNQAARLRLKFNYGQFRRLLSPAGNKAPPLHFSNSTYPSIVSGLARSLFRLPHIHPAVVFFCHTFCRPHTKLAHCFFFVPLKKQRANPPARQKRHQVRRFIPIASGPPPPYLICARKKNNPKLYLHNM